MKTIGTVDSVWRYPVKSMRGEEVAEAFVGFCGIYGDRLFGFRSSASPKGFPYLTSREQKEMLLYRPRFCHPDKAVMPPNLAEAEKLAPGITPVYADADELAVEVETPSGEVLAVDDPELLRMLGEGIDKSHGLSLLRSDRAMTDCRPVSLFAIQTAKQLSEQLNVTVDKRRFRGNIYVDFGDTAGFVEDQYVGQRVRVGAKVEMSILERDPRCKMITLDPETTEQNPEILKRVAQANDSKAGVYGAVLVEGMVCQGDSVELLS